MTLPGRIAQTWFVLAGFVLLAGRASAQADDTRESDPEQQPSIQDLQQHMEDLEARLDETRNIATFRRPIVTVGGYVDLGFFVPRATASA